MDQFLKIKIAAPVTSGRKGSMKALLTFFGILSISATVWAAEPRCTNFVDSAAVSRAGRILAHDRINFNSARITIGQKTSSVTASGGEIWLIQLEVETEKRSYQKIEYISFDQRCRLIETPDQTLSI